MEQRATRRRHPGTRAAVATLVLGLAAWPVFWTGYGLGSAALLFGGLALVPVSCLVSLWGLVSDPHRTPAGWVVVVLARAWALGWASLLLQWTWSSIVRGPNAGRAEWVFGVEWAVVAALTLLVGLGVGLTMKRLDR